jgi:hypothetical protein
MTLGVMALQNAPCRSSSGAGSSWRMLEGTVRPGVFERAYTKG